MTLRNLKAIIKEDPKSIWAFASISGAAALVLGGYELIRSPSNTLFKAAYGIENMPVVMALIPIGVVVALFIYGRLLSAFGPSKTLWITSLGSGVIIALCYFGVKMNFKPATVVLFITRQAYVVLLIEQYWSFINSTVSQKSAKIFNGPMAGIASLGAISGGIFVHELAEPLGTEIMVLFGSLTLLPAAFFSAYAYKRCGEPKRRQNEKKPVPTKDHLGLSLFKDSRLLVLLLLLVTATQAVSTMLDIRFQSVLQIEIPSSDKQTAYSGGFFALVNVFSAIFQFIVTPMALRYLSVKTIHSIIPLIHLTSAIFIIVHPTLGAGATALLLFKSFDYSIFRAAKELLYMPLSFDARYRAKEIIDVFGYRTSKGGASFIVSVLQKAGGLMLDTLTSWIAVGAALSWFVVALLLPKASTKPQKESKSTQKL